MLQSTTVSVLVHLSGCTFNLDYQKKEWQVLLRASGFGRTIGASLHEDGRTPINFSCRHRTYMASGIPLPLLFQLDRSTTLPKRASTLAYNLNDVSMITIAIRSVNNSVFQKGANVQLIMLQGPYHQ